MNKSDLIDKVSDSMGVARRDGEAAVNAVIHTVMSEVKAGKKVAITGFGAFSPSRRKARLGRNPRTGEPVKVAAAKGVRFAPGRVFKDVVNGRAQVPAPTKTVTKATAKKAAVTKSTTEKAATKKVAAKKVAAKKAFAKRAPARKAVGPKTTAKRAPARKVASRKPPAKKSTAKRTSARKGPARRAAGRRR